MMMLMLVIVKKVQPGESLSTCLACSGTHKKSTLLAGFMAHDYRAFALSCSSANNNEPLFITGSSNRVSGLSAQAREERHTQTDWTERQKVAHLRGGNNGQ